MKPNLKLEIVDAILGKVNAAIETTGGLIYTDSKKVFLDLVPHVKLEEYMATLKELKKAGALEDFENRDDCFYILHPSQSRLYEIRRSLSSPTEQKSKEKPLKLSFDANSGKIIWGDKECELPLKKMEYYVAQALFEYPPETKLTEDHLMRYIDPESCPADSPNRIYDAVRRINKKIKETFNIQRLILYKESNFWMRKVE